jgi:hypothetical protein
VTRIPATRALPLAIAMAIGASSSVLVPDLAVLAASPSPGASPVPTETIEPFSPGFAWLDAALPTGAAAGSKVSIGAFLWSPHDERAVTGATVRFTLHPASGKAAPTTATGVPTWRGHFVADLLVPAGGFGRLTMGFPGNFCSDAGCLDQDFLFEIAGVGPPTDVPLTAIATGHLTLSEPVVQSRAPAAVDVTVSANAPWPTAIDLPDALVVQVRERQGGVVSEVPAVATAAEPGHYTATVTLIQPGDYVVQLATTEGATPGALFGTAIAPLTVERAPVSAQPAPTTGSLPDWWPLGLAGIGLLVAALLFVRGRPRDERV